MAGENQVLQYKDVNYRGPTPNADFILTSTNAIKNIIKMYLMSEKGDYGRNIGKGGPLVTLLGKTMSDNDVPLVETKIREALSTYENIIIHTLKVERELEKRNWLITIMFSDTYNKFTDTTNLVIRG